MLVLFFFFMQIFDFLKKVTISIQVSEDLVLLEGVKYQLKLIVMKTIFRDVVFVVACEIRRRREHGIDTNSEHVFNQMRNYAFKDR